MSALSRISAGLVLAAVLVAGATHVESRTAGFAEGIVSADGSIRLPASFRTDYVMLGAWSVSGDADTGGGVGLHLVYAPESAVAAYRETGSFPDGTVLVKELFRGAAQTLTTGRATRAAETTGYFVMVKDVEGRFPGHPLWGDGWGWSFFEAADTSATTTRSYAQECLGCHVPARSKDLVYVQGYPLLKP